jgi:hypothetical protein
MDDEKASLAFAAKRPGTNAEGSGAPGFRTERLRTGELSWSSYATPSG